MRVLIGCEESGVVRRAFCARGHEAWSNDLLPARDGSKYHLKCDVMKALYWDDWDIVILHPDCTAMALSGNRWYGKGMPFHKQRVDAIVWTRELWRQAKKCSRVGCALENPTGVLWSEIGKPQWIQPWQFGHGETKKTGIITDRLPPLLPTNIVEGREQRIWRMPPGENRKRDSSETFKGIGDAMADQWGSLLA